MKTIKFLILLLIALLLLALGFFEGRKAYWDSKVQDMCHRDGGVKIYEFIDVEQEDYEIFKNKFGNVHIQKKEDTSETNPMLFRVDRQVYIRRVNPEVIRFETSIFRKNNKSLVATSISYSRVGGDFFALHPSYFSCPQKPKDFFASIFRVKGDK